MALSKPINLRLVLNGFGIRHRASHNLHECVVLFLRSRPSASQKRVLYSQRRLVANQNLLALRFQLSREFGQVLEDGFVRPNLNVWREVRAGEQRRDGLGGELGGADVERGG